MNLSVRNVHTKETDFAGKVRLTHCLGSTNEEQKWLTGASVSLVSVTGKHDFKAGIYHGILFGKLRQPGG